MAGRIERRIGPVLGSSLRYAVVPIGSLAVSWWVVHQGSMQLWSAVVAPLVLVQLAVHLSQWGQRDLLLRILRSGHVDGAACWRENGWSRALVALPLVVLPALITGLSLPWMLLWAASASVAGSFEPLIVRDKRFMPALLADVAGLLAQFAVLVLADALDTTVVVRSFAVHNAVRCAGLWWASGCPRPWPPVIDLHLHLGKAVPFVLIGLGGLLATRIDVYAVTALGDGDLVGRYQVVAALFVQFQVIPGLLARPFTTGLLRLDPTTLARASDRAMRWGLLLALPQAWVAGLVLAHFFHVDVGWPVLLAGALSVVPAYGYVPLFPVLYSLHREQWVVVLSFGAAACIALGAWSLVPRWGIAGGLAASALGQWVQWAGVRLLVERFRK
ncbi:MAG TPA: hypothetical protein VHL57_07730 [Flavobacteriales bacterium]|nr:hypothetical protein [Flavobacteriales bacterium]